MGHTPTCMHSQTHGENGFISGVPALLKTIIPNFKTLV